jgi:hypothetical protein
MNKKILIITILTLFTLISYSYAYDNKITHKDLTRQSVLYSNLGDYLKQHLGLTKGFNENIRGKQVIDWLMEGSYAEDKPPCRASNHFHNPLLPWGQSYMSDEPELVTLWCGEWFPFYSNVTWATGYYAPPPDGSKANFNNHPFKTYNWDAARLYYYLALTEKIKGFKEDYFAKLFENLGHVLHLLQDVSVPAHTRNDFRSHIFNNKNSFWGMLGLDRYQPFEKYVEINPWLVTASNPDGNFPDFANTRLTDFWDTNQYIGNNPSAGLNIGLAEFSNANYFSNYTILSNGPTLEHNFPRPSINNAEYQICTDYQHNSLKK